ncbi:MAG: UDP-3-O-(3-hydroxymyristoyl)glucosamine N-acyltransferase [Bacteroidota bacterium]|nr:UDP-3-O-(3-hydroxymyristoyl)glucosamine N-acyltransferase [Bacteroidota bacterium]
MEFTAKAIAEFLKGEIEGDAEIVISNVSKIEEGEKGTITFLANPKYTEYAYTTDASIIIVNKSFVPNKKIKATLIKVDDAYQAIASLLQLKESMKPKKVGIHPKSWMEKSSKAGKDLFLGAYAYVGENCIIGKNVRIYPHVYIGDNVVIGDNCTFYPGVKIYHECKIGNDCILHGGVVIGSDGFGFAPDTQKDYKKVPQIGNVILKDRVEIGSNTTIDRAMMGSTIIEEGVKLDNLIMVAHNVVIGENTIVAAQSGIAGSTKIGRECMFGGQVGLVGHIEIADKVMIAAQSGIPSSIKKEGVVVQGSPAFPIMDYQKSYVYFRKLPSLVTRINELEKKLKELEQDI